jgi:hypothetical protein
MARQDGNTDHSQRGPFPLATGAGAVSGRLQDEVAVVTGAARGIGAPEEVAYTALFLASDEARIIDATDILVDAGRSQIHHD